MGKFFEELAKKLAERWVALLVLPGALFILVTALAWPDPVRRWRAAARRRRWLSQVGKRVEVDRDDPDRQAKVDRFAERANRIAMAIDLAFGWSRLWLVLPDTVRAEITAAEAAFGVTGWAKGRHAIAELTALSEAAVDLHGRTLARALGVGDQEETGVLTIEQGRAITALVRKGR
ncbi:hypothetical protein ABZ345_37525 [Lentzea sp. NPDC005914]|uniref:hypothetical protein n=1 Tax=Lentzea sp. NPDC005914 TaxID=3154572 RepID=UPI0033E82EB9